MYQVRLYLEIPPANWVKSKENGAYLNDRQYPNCFASIDNPVKQYAI